MEPACGCGSFYLARKKIKHAAGFLSCCIWQLRQGNVALNLEISHPIQHGGMHDPYRSVMRLNSDLIGRSGDRLPRSDDTSHFRSVSPSTRNRTPVPSVMLCEAKHRQCSAARFVALAARSVQHDIRRNAWALEIYVPRLLLLVC